MGEGYDAVFFSLGPMWAGRITPIPSKPGEHKFATTPHDDSPLNPPPYIRVCVREYVGAGAEFGCVREGRRRPLWKGYNTSKDERKQKKNREKKAKGRDGVVAEVEVEEPSFSARTSPLRSWRSPVLSSGEQPVIVYVVRQNPLRERVTDSRSTVSRPGAVIC